MAGKIQAWLGLFRPPNLLTVPGDVLAGAFLAGQGVVISGSSIAMALAVGFCIYPAGLLLNDWVDEGVDLRERPGRPLPSGMVGRRSAAVTATALILAGLMIALAVGREVLVVALLLSVAVANYNFLTKNIILLGALNMGFCRALHLLLGAVAVGGFDLSLFPLGGAAVVFLYVFAVTHIARREIGGRYFWPERWLPCLIVTAAFFIHLPFSDLVYWQGQVAVLLLMTGVVLITGRVAVLLPKRAPSLVPPEPVPPLIGRLIGGLVMIQSALVFASGDTLAAVWTGLGLFLLWPLQRGLGKWFYSS